MHTYHEAVEQISSWYDAEALLAQWSREWESSGWEPVVLGRSMAERHPRWRWFRDAVAELPSVNAAAYEAACFHRWMAMAVVGGGFMADADVLPNNIAGWDPPPARAGAHVVVHARSPDGELNPGLVQATATGFGAACAAFVAAGRAAAAAGAEHVSDQELLRAGSLPVDGRADVRTYGDPASESAVAIHYTTDSLVAFEGPKSVRIATARSVVAG